MSKSGKKRRREAWTPRTPVVVPGGIRVQNNRSIGARAWWGRRWLETLEGLALGARMGRGRSYASSGQIRELRVEPGLVEATVQGAEAKPYVTQFQLRVLDEAGLKNFQRALRENPVWLARLAVRDFPAEFEKVFNQLGCPLFPSVKDDLIMRCTCRDWQKPCKHLAALFYVMAEAVERDPLLLLVMRGVPREWLVEGACRQCAFAPRAPQADVGAADEGVRPPDRDFWGAGCPAFSDYGPMPKGSPTPLVRNLGPLPFWRGVERFVDTMEQVYARSATLGAAVWGGEKVDFTPVKAEREAPLFYPKGRFRVDWM